MLRLTPHTKHPTSMEQAITPRVLLVGVRGVDLSLPAEISLVGSIDSSSSKAMHGDGGGKHDASGDNPPELLRVGRVVVGYRQGAPLT